MKVLLLRFDAPLISFGGTVVDANNVTEDMPARSMVVGLLGNALGYDHRDVAALGDLQSRVRHGARCDRPGELLVDFQTVDLSQDFLQHGWTTWGRREGRDGGSAASGTHIRKRHYLADAVYTVAVTLEPSEEEPTLEDLLAALEAPARPLFLGRKACLPSHTIAGGIVNADSLFDALVRAPLRARRRRAGRRARCLVSVPWGTPLPTGVEARERAVTEERDWPNQVHVGRSRVLELVAECGRDGSDAT